MTGASQDNLKLARSLYDAFASGNIPAFIAAMDPRIEWSEATGFPHGGTYHGMESVMSNVFAPLEAEWVEFRVTPEEFVDSSETVVVLGQYDGTYRATGKTFKAPFAHVWRFRDGKAVRFVQHTDTLLVNRALAS
jgi:uncharacterized protein